jgi:molybdopterin-guanine dinucleotide biosynthesis protein A
MLADDPEYPDLGPLSGICPAIEDCKARFAVLLPVDLPLLPPSLVRFLLHHAESTESAITVASIGGFVQTFPVVIDRKAGPALRTSLRSQDRKCLTAFRAAAEKLAKPMSVLAVESLIKGTQVTESRGLQTGDWFLGINTPGDLARAEGLLRTNSIG